MITLLKKKLTILFFIFSFSPNCLPKIHSQSKEKESRTENNYKVEYGTPQVIESFELILFPKYQNYLGKDKSRIKLESEYTSRSSSYSNSNNKMNITNYKFRNINNFNSKFQNLFPIDVLILNEFDKYKFIINQEQKFKSPVFTFRVIEEDTNNDNVIDENDRVSIFLFELPSQNLYKITSNNINIESVVFEGFSDSKSKEYIIIYSARKNDSKKLNYYLYKVKEKTTEEFKLE